MSKLTGKAENLTMYVPQVEYKDVDIIGISVDEETAELINYCIANSWDSLSVEDKVLANRLLLRINRLL